MDPKNTWRIKKVKVTTVDGRRYGSTILAYPLETVSYFNFLRWSSYITASNRTEITILTELLDEMAAKLANTTLTAYATNYPHCIVGRNKNNTRNGKYYRIDNANLLVDLSSSAPELELRYRVGGVTHAIVVIKVKPSIAEKGMRNELIERRGIDDFGFSSRLFMEVVKESMIHSAGNDCRVCICWNLIEEREEGFFEKVMRMVTHPNVVSVSTCAAKVIGKTVASESLKSAMDGVSSGAVELAAKVLTQESCEYVSENILKRVPVLGILAVLILALRRLWSGDVFGAACEVLSGYLSGWQVLVSVALDVVMCVQDLRESGAIKKAYGNCLMMMISGIVMSMTVAMMT